MYQLANSKIAHVMKRAVGRNIVVYWSNIKLALILKQVLSQLMFIVVDSNPVLRKISIGVRLVRHAIFVVII